MQSIKNLLWRGNVEEALERLADLILDVDLIRKHSASAENCQPDWRNSRLTLTTIRNPSPITVNCTGKEK